MERGRIESDGLASYCYGSGNGSTFEGFNGFPDRRNLGFLELGDSVSVALTFNTVVQILLFKNSSLVFMLLV